MSDWAICTGGGDAACWGRRLLWMFEVGGGEGGVVSVGSLTLVAFVVVARRGLWSDFSGLRLGLGLGLAWETR